MPERARRAYYRDPGDVEIAPRVSAEPRRPKPLYGAAAIADYLHIKTKKVYHLMECHGDSIPIRKVSGIGLASDEYVLSKWWDRVVIRGESQKGI